MNLAGLAKGGDGMYVIIVTGMDGANVLSVKGKDMW